MPKLNYNKWDSLELSDDSDIEVHPNVDKKSMIRWKQRDIHEKRELRKLKLHHLALEKTMNQELLQRMDALLAGVRDSSAFLEREASRLRAAVPDFDTKTFADGEQPSQDHMVLNLILQIAKAVKESGGKKTEEGELLEHRKRLADRQLAVDKEREEEEKEQKKHITSDDIHTGFESKTLISNKPSAVPQSAPKADHSAPKKTTKSTTTVIETLNSPSTSATTSSEPAPTADPDDSDSDEEAAPLTPSAIAFSELPSLNFEMAYKFISAHPDLLDPALVDSLLVEAFSQAMKGQDKRAKVCVEKSLMLQYCHKLGRDGVSLFFKRMSSGKAEGLKMFLDDVNQTADRLIARAHVVAAEKKEEQGQGTEQIQLVATEEGLNITFEVPDGPPPENLEITGEGAEQFDPVEVRAYLQRQWDIFTSFPKNFQKALQSKSLEAVNKILGKMSVEEAEEVVKQLQEGGILSFESSEIRDTTRPQGEEVQRAEEPEPSEVD